MDTPEHCPDAIWTPVSEVQYGECSGRAGSVSGFWDLQAQLLTEGSGRQCRGIKVMARSNGIQDRTGGQQGRQAHPGEAVEHGLPWSNGQGAGVPVTAAQQGYDPHAAGQLPWPQQGQQPYAPGYQPAHTAPPLQQYQGQQPITQGYAPPQYPQPQAYAPQADAHHGHYFPQAAHGAAPHDYAQQQAYLQAGYAPQSGYQDPASQLRGSYPGHGEVPYTAPPTQQHDPRQFDLGAYGNQAAGYADPATGRTLPPVQGSLPAGAQNVPFGKATPAQPAEAYHEDDFEDEDDEEEQPRRRFGVMKVLGVLALAIGIGGGAAYGVKKFGGSLMTASTKPVTVKADVGPTKSKSAVADSKAAERLGGDAVPAVVPAGDAQGDTPGSPRKVQTVAISPPAATLRPTVSIPGVTVEGGLPPAPPAPVQQQAVAFPPVTQAPPGRAVAPPPAAALPQRAPVAPKVIATVEEPAAAPKAAAARIPVAQAPKAGRASDAYSPASGVGAATVAAATTAPAAAAPARPAGGNGYIAVLASTGSAIDSRKALDDLQGRYSESIGGKPTDVREFVNPRDGKTYYRAVVGPPGSREAANTVCEQMKTAGHKDCFTAAY
jgi:SPOR domain